MNRSSILRFEELIQLWRRSCCSLSMPQLLGLNVGSRSESDESELCSLDRLNERFRNTWWEVIWPKDSIGDTISRQVKCRYVADSLPDALRERPNEDFPYINVWDLLYMCDLEDETDDPEDDELRRLSIINL